MSCRALLICDLQPDLLVSIPSEAREALLSKLRLATEGARRAGWLVVFSGLRFPSRYEGVDAGHRLHGALARLNAKVGDKGAHWFMEGYPGADIERTVMQQGDEVVWRQRHFPPTELLEVLRDRNVGRVTVCGLKAAYAVQLTCQALCDAGLSVDVLRECVQDDVPARLAAVLEHVLPIYADVVPWEDFLGDLGVIETGAEPAREGDVAEGADGASRDVYDCSDCKRGGHCAAYCKALLERPNWQSRPTQTWYVDEYWKEYYCPIGKRVVDFTDEPKFSRAAMYVRGREWLEDKSKFVEIAGRYVPETFVIERGAWQGAVPSEDSRCAPWFVKKADGNWGMSVQCCLRPSDCLNLAKEGGRYIVQGHVADPLLTDDGCKCHIKFYVLVFGLEDETTWRVYTYQDGYLSISPNKWRPDDTSTDTQVTIIRNSRISTYADGKGWAVWPDVYPKCKAAVAEMIGRAVRNGRLKGRDGKKQFEILSADFIVDVSGRVWCFEFNCDCVLRDKEFSEDIHDDAMVRGALSIVMPWDGGSPEKWELAGEFSSAAGV